MKPRLAFALLFVLAAAGCFPKSGPVPPAPDASDPEATAGHDVFVAKCNNCHGYPDVNAIDQKDWPSIVSRMGKKADLDAKQTQSVLRFITVSEKH